MSAISNEIIDLHNVTEVDDLKKLLRKGCDINEKNEFDETPLLCAIRNGERWEIIEEFLNYGADPNAADCWGKTPLYCAITNNGNLKIIKLLLENGADIKGGKPINDRALDSAFIQNKPCAELVLKYKFLRNSKFVKTIVAVANTENSRNYYNDYKDVVDLNLKPSCYKNFSVHMDNCASEILHMKTVQLCPGFSLLDFVTIKNSLESLKQETKLHVIFQIYKELLVHDYNIYKNMIASRIGREYLLKNITETYPFMNFNMSSNHQMKNQRFLNSDAVYCIASYLSNIDLLNFILAHLVKN